MFNLFQSPHTQQKPTDIKDDVRYNQAQSDMKVLLASQIANKIDSADIMLHDNIQSLAAIMKESGEKEYIYDNVKFSIDFLGLIGIDLLD